MVARLPDQESTMKKRFWINRLGFAAMLTLAGAPAVADQTVSISGPLGIGGSRAVLIKPEAPRASVILMPGGDGSIRAGGQGDIHGLVGNQLVRTRHAYADLGLAVLVVDASTDLGSAVEYMAAIKRPVTVIATSAGTIRAAQGIWRGARPDALVLTSGLLSPKSSGDDALVLASGLLSPKSGSGKNVMSILGSPALLPPTLVIHHRQDGCNGTLPAGVEPFIEWSAGHARATWVSGGTNEGNACEALAYHGFNGLDRQIVGIAGSFR
jgi:hypothetical protein